MTDERDRIQGGGCKVGETETTATRGEVFWEREGSVQCRWRRKFWFETEGTCYPRLAGPGTSGTGRSGRCPKHQTSELTRGGHTSRTRRMCRNSLWTSRGQEDKNPTQGLSGPFPSQECSRLPSRPENRQGWRGLGTDSESRPTTLSLPSPPPSPRPKE